MKYVGRELKGTWQYIKKQTIFEIIKTLILFLMAIGIYIIGYVNLGTNKSLWSIIAVLALLPACKSLVGVIMLAMFRSLPEDKYEKYISVIGNLGVLFENVITTSKKSYYFPIIVCENNNIIALLKTKKENETKEITEHLQKVLKDGGHKSASLKIYTNEDAFLERASQMKENFDEKSKAASTKGIFETIKAVSL